MEKVSLKDGVITIEHHVVETGLKSLKGLQFDHDYLSQYMVTDSEKWWLILKIHTFWLLTREDFQYPRNLAASKYSSSNRPLLIIADDVDGEALPTLVMNKIRGTFNVVAVKALVSVIVVRLC